MKKNILYSCILIITIQLLLPKSGFGQPFKNLQEQPGGPENSSAKIKLSNDGKNLSLIYNGSEIFSVQFNEKVKVTTTSSGNDAITQKITIQLNKRNGFKAKVNGSSEALAAETGGKAQRAFAIIRTSHGLSNNLRNNAIYDRNLDWMLQASEGTVIKSRKNTERLTNFELTFKNNREEIFFYPKYYQKHKNLPYYQPWNYKVYKESITGWSSWWAYFREFTEKDQNKILEVWQKKHFADYGYRFIQIDDVYHGENDKGRENSEMANSYYGGRPTTWLDWKKDLFPGGIANYVNSINAAGFKSAIWMGCFFSDKKTANEHPDWLVTDKNGKPVETPWVSYTMDATNPEVVETLIRPTFKGLKNAGLEYVKIDQLRHFLYDCLNNNLDWCKRKGVTPDQVVRAYLQIAREELGDKAFILACWGTLPESIGLVDACRIGGDGFGPVTMQQYNSWNGIVWRNDPDHCDILPRKAGQGTGNITETKDVKAIRNESIIRPALASIAGAMLLLSDKPEVYENENNLIGLRRSSPVLFSVPGQLYDFDASKTDWLKSHQRTEIVSGKSPAPVDGDQFGNVCPYWLNEFNTDIESWNVFHILNWSEKDNTGTPAKAVAFKDLGLDSSKEYLVYEFWSDKFLGVLKNQIQAEGLAPYGLQSFAIREKLNRPQLVSTNRHLSQGAVEVEMMLWDSNSIKGRSRMIVNDKYVMSFYVPDGYKFKTALVDGKPAAVEKSSNLLKVNYTPSQTASLSWEINFEKS
ncbi:alpha-galactosidase [Pedobacter sp. B4-66]|uniref:alpha-galactosidase n=1 Tax=Pedobacter sp. B4-66 TaxID=2817280 RepID=UPI001BD9C2C2|nr:alpha-galactosidase [Pedobacter sp. B4-66]